MDDIVAVKTNKAIKPRPLQAASIPWLPGMFQNAPKLFSGLNFHFSDCFLSSYKGYYRDLVVPAGGNVLSKRVIIYLDSKIDTEATNLATFLIYNACTEESVDESSLIEQRCQEEEPLAAKTVSQAPHT